MSAREEILEALTDGPKSFDELSQLITRDFGGRLRKLVAEGLVKQSGETITTSTYELADE